MPPNSRFSSPDTSSSASSTGDSASVRSVDSAVTGGSIDWERPNLQLEDVLQEARFRRIWVTRRRLARAAYFPVYRPPIRDPHYDRAFYDDPFSRTPWVLRRRQPAPVFIGLLESEDDDGNVQELRQPLSPAASEWAQQTVDGAMTIPTQATYYQSEGGLELF